MLQQLTMKLQDIITPNRNRLIGFMNDVQRIPIPQYLRLCPVSRRRLILHQLLQSRVCSDDALDPVRAFRTLNPRNLHQPLQLNRFLLRIPFLLPFIFMNLRHIRQNLIIPGSFLQLRVIKRSHTSPFLPKRPSFSQLYMHFGRKRSMLGEIFPSWANASVLCIVKTQSRAIYTTCI